MSLWVHKYRPKNLSELDHLPVLTGQLKALAHEEELPHLLIYGPPGGGKQTRVACLLNELFGPGSTKIKIESRQLDLGGSRKIEVTMASSVYHVEITPSEAGMQDRFIIQELLKEIAQTQQVDQNAKHRFKVVVIHDADTLSREAQAALRRTMEIYSANLRLILVSNSLSPVIAPIRSRTLLLRVSAPTVDEISAVLERVAENEGVHVAGPKLYSRIAETSQRNLRKALLIMEAMYAQHESLNANAVIPLADWETMLIKEASDIVRFPGLTGLAQARTTNYQLLSHCIPPQIILKTLLLQVLKLIDARLAPDVIEAAALFDHRLRLGSKPIFHLEAFIARVMNLVASSK